MSWAMEWSRIFLPWMFLFGLILLFVRLVFWAKNRKTVVLLMGAFMQMVLPDPYAERTIKIVQEQKKENKKNQNENGAPPAEEDT